MSSFLRRFLAAVGDATPAFAEPRRVAGGGFWRRLLIAMSDSAPAFTPTPTPGNWIIYEPSPDRQRIKTARARLVAMLNQSRVLAFVSVLVFLDTVFFSALPPLLPHYEVVAGLSKAGAGVLVASYAVGTVAGSLMSGAFSRRLGDRRLVILGLLVMSGATLVFGWSSAVWLLDAMRFTQGLAGAWTWAAGLAWLSGKAAEGQRGTWLGLAMGAAVIGSFCGPAVAILSNYAGPGTVFTIGSITMLAWAILAFTLPRPQPESPAPQKFPESLQALRAPGLGTGIWIMTFAGMAFGVINVLAPIRLAQLGASGTIIAATFIGGAVVAAALGPVAGWSADRFGRKRTLIIPLLAGAAFAILAWLPTEVQWLIPLLILGTPFFDILFTPASAMVSDGADELKISHGTAFMLTNMTWALGQAIAAISSGVLAAATSDAIPFLMVAFACTATFAGLLARPVSRSANRRLTFGKRSRVPAGSETPREDAGDVLLYRIVLTVSNRLPIA